MSKIVKLTNETLNTLIKKVLKEQEENQVGTNGPEPEEITGSPNDEEGGEPNYEAFMEIAKELLGQGMTIGNLVDKLLIAQTPEDPEPDNLPTEPEPDSAIPSDNQ